MEKFSFENAVEELERIATTLEDPATPIGQLDVLTERSRQLVELCRKYLRETREKSEIV